MADYLHSWKEFSHSIVCVGICANTLAMMKLRHPVAPQDSQQFNALVDRQSDS
jgi:hypothetical protein